MPSRRRDCHAAAPPSPFSRRFNRDDEGVPAKGESRRRLSMPRPRTGVPCTADSSIPAMSFHPVSCPPAPAMSHEPTAAIPPAARLLITGRLPSTGNLHSQWQSTADICHIHVDIPQGRCVKNIRTGVNMSGQSVRQTGSRCRAGQLQ